MVSGDLEQSLRAQIDGYIESHLGGIRDEIARLQSQFNEAFTRLSERLQSASESDASIAVAVSEHLRDARNSGIETASAEGARARASSDIAILKAGIDDIDEQRSQADILNTLINRAASFAPRVAFFVIKNERATGWRARGLEGTVGDDAIREISLPLEADTLLSEVARTRRTWSGAPGSHGEDNQIYGRFGGDEPPQRIVAIPLVARDKAVAVLYADSHQQDSDAINLEAIETLVRVAGMAVELLATKRPAPASSASVSTATDSSSASTPAFSAQPPQPPAQASAPPEARMPEAARATSSTPFTRDEPAPQPLTGAPQAETVDATASAQSQPTFVEPTFVENTGGYEGSADLRASSVQDQPPAPPTPAPTPASTYSAPLGTARRYGADAELPVEVNESERRFHTDARRFARLLVSEIKLYNEQKVKDGRSQGNLYNLLREDIDRSRQMYDKRISPEVTARYDYFHHELVKTLAEGDPSRLGAGYPGNN